MSEVLIGLGTAVFAIINILRRLLPSLEGWWAVGAALSLSALGVVVFDLDAFAAMSEAELETWVSQVLSIFATFTASGVVHKAWTRLS